MTVVRLSPPTPSGDWPPHTGPVPSPTHDTLIAWSADRGWMSSEFAGSPTSPPVDALGVTVALPQE